MKINGKVKQLAFFGKESRAGLVILAEIAAGAMMALASLWVFAEIADEVIEKKRPRLIIPSRPQFILSALRR